MSTSKGLLYIRLEGLTEGRELTIYLEGSSREAELEGRRGKADSVKHTT
jgi:hypothetical protein